MKIIAVNKNSGGGLINAVVSMAREELRVVAGLQSWQSLDALGEGSVRDVCKTYEHAMAVLRRIGESANLPETLRTLASMLELSHPALANIVEPTVEPKPDEAR